MMMPTDIYLKEGTHTKLKCEYCRGDEFRIDHILSVNGKIKDDGYGDLPWKIGKSRRVLVCHSCNQEVKN